MNSIQANYQRLCLAYEKFSYLTPTQPEFQPARKNLFARLDQMLPTHVSALDTDIYYDQAEKVRRRESFQEEPLSLDILARPANNYCNLFQETIALIQQSPKKPHELFHQKITELKEAHLAFTRRFISEYQRVYADTSAVIHQNHSAEIQLFLEALFRDLSTHQAHIENQDAEVLTMLPCLAIEKIVANHSQEIPALFDRHAEKLYKLGFVYRDLSEAEKENLHLKLICYNDKTDIALQPVTHELWRSLHLIASSLRSKEFNRIFKVVLEEAQKASFLLQILAQSSLQTDVQAAKALLISYLENADFRLPLALYHEKYRFPMQKMKAEKAGKEEISALAHLIALEPKVAPWLCLIKAHSRAQMEQPQQITQHLDLDRRVED